MKDLIIPSKRIKIELYKIIIFFVIANIMNLFSIIKFDTKWSELITQLHIVVLLTLFFYLVSVIVLGVKTLILYFRTGKLVL